MSRSKFIRGLETRLVHGGEPEPRILGAASMPIFQSATFEYAGGAGSHGVRYIRYNNTPNQLSVAAKIAPLEGADAALVTGSGMAAISATLLTFLSQGDHAVTLDSLYGGTYDLIHSDLARFGITTTPVDGQQPATWEAALRPTTRVLYFETITNPQIRVPDLDAAVAFAKKHGLVSIIDNTLASPVNFRAVEHGFDIALHSGSKYLNGHSDIVSGAVTGTPESIDAIRHTLNRFGGTLDPHAAFLLQRGLKTLSIRVKQHNQSATEVASFLAAHPAVERVSHLSLADHPDHDRAARLFGGFGGMISFTLADPDPATADAFLNQLQLPMVGGSLGGPESLVTRPAVTVHAALKEEDRERIGIPEHLIRLSVGLESPEDLTADIGHALEVAVTAGAGA